MLTVTLLVLGAAFVTAIAHAMGKCPASVPILLLCVVLLLRVLPK